MNMTDLEIFIENWKPQGNQDGQQELFMKQLLNLVDKISGVKCKHTFITTDVFKVCTKCNKTINRF